MATNALFQSNHSLMQSSGALFAFNTLALTNTTFLSNTAASFGGAVGAVGAATLNGGLFRNNVGMSGAGGGLLTFDTLSVSGTQFISNTAGTKGGGAFAAGAATLVGTQFSATRRQTMAAAQTLAVRRR